MNSSGDDARMLALEGKVGNRPFGSAIETGAPVHLGAVRRLPTEDQQEMVQVLASGLKIRFALPAF
jgi:hypothetical protein